MNEAKPWYLSKTIWASLVTVASAVAGMGGLPVVDLDTSALADSLLQAVTAISGVVAIFGRLSARAQIS